MVNKSIHANTIIRLFPPFSVYSNGMKESPMEATPHSGPELLYGECGMRAAANGGSSATGRTPAIILGILNPVTVRHLQSRESSASLARTMNTEWAGLGSTSRAGYTGCFILGEPSVEAIPPGTRNPAMVLFGKERTTRLEFVHLTADGTRRCFVTPV